MIYICCGLPRCGKSTFTKAFINNGVKRVIVSGDSVRLALTNIRFNPQSEEMVHAVKNIMIKALIIAGHDIVYDGTNTTVDSISKLEKIAKQYEQEIFWFIFDVDKETCIKRAINTQQEDLIPVIEKMSKQIPAAKEYILKQYPNNYTIIKEE